MRVFTTLPQEDLRKVAPAACVIEGEGYDGVASMENRHDPFLALAVAGAATERIELHTSVAIAFAAGLVHHFPAFAIPAQQRAFALEVAFSVGRLRIGHHPGPPVLHHEVAHHEHAVAVIPLGPHGVRNGFALRRARDGSYGLEGKLYRYRLNLGLIKGRAASAESRCPDRFVPEGSYSQRAYAFCHVERSRDISHC